jgi:hypothetical protein
MMMGIWGILKSSKLQAPSSSETPTIKFQTILALSERNDLGV